MNTDNGEIRPLAKGELEALIAKGEPWTGLAPEELTLVRPLPPEARPAALREHRASRAKKRKEAAAARRRNRR